MARPVKPMTKQNCIDLVMAIVSLPFLLGGAVIIVAGITAVEIKDMAVAGYKMWKKPSE